MKKSNTPTILNIKFIFIIFLVFPLVLIVAKYPVKVVPIFAPSIIPIELCKLIILLQYISSTIPIIPDEDWIIAVDSIPNKIDNKFLPDVLSAIRGYMEEYYIDSFLKDADFVITDHIKVYYNGSEKIEEEILRFFPNARVKRMDLDTTHKKNDYLEIIQDFEKGNIDILCGTQIITKGLDFSNVGLVGVIDADSLLYYPDFRAYERCFDLLTQVAGRAGRLKEKGVVVIQSFNPNHQIFKEVLNYDYASMYKNQIVERKLFSYPPFVYLTKILFQSKDKDVLDSLCQEYSNEIRKIFAQRILGPEYPPIYRVKGMYQKQFILKLEKTISYTQAKKLIMQLNEEILSKKEYKQVK